MSSVSACVGFNLRLPWLDYILEELPPLPHLEIIADNWLSPGPHHEKLAKVREHYPILFHCVGMNIGGDDPLDFQYLSSIKELASRYQPLHLSDHLCFQHVKSHYFHDLLPIPLHDDSLRRCTDRIDEIQSFFGESILVENLSYYVEYDNSEFSEAFFLDQLARKSGAGLLLDLNNIWVNQQNLGINLDRYISNIDLSQVREIHLAGPSRQDEFYVDTHGSEVVDEVKDVFQAILSQIERSIPVIYERDDNLPEPQEMVQLCQELEGLI